MSGLHVWEFEEDWVVAATAQDARRVLINETGYADEECEEPTLVPDDKPFSIMLDPGVSGERTTKTAAEWAAEMGPGHLCGTNW